MPTEVAMAERTDAAREAVFSFGRCPEVDVTLGRNTGSRCISCFVSSLTFFFFWGAIFASVRASTCRKLSARVVIGFDSPAQDDRI